MAARARPCVRAFGWSRAGWDLWKTLQDFIGYRNATVI